MGLLIERKQTCGLGYNLTLKRNNNIQPVIRTGGADAAKLVIEDFDWHIPHFTPFLENQKIAMDQLLKINPTEFYYMERIVYSYCRNSWISS